MKRKTVTFSDDLHRRIQSLRGKRITESGKTLSFSHLVEELVAEGLRNGEAICDLLEACKTQHQAIDRLFAELIKRDPNFFPSKSGQPWEAVQKGNAAIAKAEGRS